LLIGSGLGIPIAVLGSFFTDVRAFLGVHPLFGYSTFAVGCAVGLLNFYLSWLRPIAHRLRSDGTDLRRISGLPVLGNIAVIGLLFAPRSLALSTAALVQIALDTGGLQFLVRPILLEILF
jgi:hypothetical protein